MNIYVGNLAREVSNDDLMEAFQPFGEVVSASIIKDKFSGESRGFGFVEMPSKEAAEQAINSVKEIKGRMVTVNEARPRTENRSSRPRHGSSGPRGGHRDRGYRDRSY